MVTEESLDKLQKKVKKFLIEKRFKTEIEKLARNLAEVREAFDLQAFLKDNPDSHIIEEYNIPETDLGYIRELALERIQKYFDSLGSKEIFDTVTLQISIAVSREHPEDVEKKRIKDSVIKEAISTCLESYRDFDQARMLEIARSIQLNLIHDMYYLKKLEKNFIKLSTEHAKLTTDYTNLLNASLKDKEMLSTAQEGYNKIKNDYANLKKRTEKEKEEYQAKAGSELIRDLVEVLDDFDRAIQQMKGNEEVLNGFTMIQNKLSMILSRKGLERIESDGAKFDPEKHEAILVDPRTDVEDNTITETIRPGYLLNGSLIRASLVKVAQNKDNENDRA